MSELPRTDDLPRSDEGLDPERVEEAFSSFAERVRELESVADELRAELRGLRAERAAGRNRQRAPEPYDDEDWPADGGFSEPPSPDWVASVPPPLRRAFAIPRIALEAAFLLAIGLLAGLADLDPVWIALVMGTAWVLVALSEWTAARKRARWRLDEVAPSVASDGDQAGESTGPWSMPVVEATALQPADDSESRTVIATLPEEPKTQDPETGDPQAGPDVPDLVQPSEPESTPARRGLRLWRRRPAAQADSDPWER